MLPLSSMYYNINIKLFSKYNAETCKNMSYTCLVCPANKSAVPQKSYG